MKLPWPSAFTFGGNIPDEDQKALQAILDSFADALADRMTKKGLQPHDSPIWRPWNLVVLRDAEKFFAAFCPLQSGMSSLRWIDQPEAILSSESMMSSVVSQLGMPVSTVVTLPRPDMPTSPANITDAVDHHMEEIERTNRLGRLGDLTGLSHLQPDFYRFLDDHPDPDRNVFVMMRFIDSPQMNDIYNTIKITCSSYGFHAIRADERDYTGELWSNIEVYMTSGPFQDH